MNTFTKAGKTIVAITKQDWIKIGQSAGWNEERDGRSDSGIVFLSRCFTLIDNQITVTRNALNHQINIKKSSNPELIKQLEEKLRILKSKKQQLVGEFGTIKQQLEQEDALNEISGIPSGVESLIQNERRRRHHASTQKLHIKLAQKMDLSVPAVEKRLKAFFSEMSKKVPTYDIMVQQLNLHTIYQQCPDLNPSRVENLAMECGLHVTTLAEKNYRQGVVNVILEDTAPSAGNTIRSTAQTKPGIDYKAFFEAVQNWQQKVMHNACTVCWGNNLVDECAACGWWGKVKPANWTRGDEKSTGPNIEDFRLKPADAK